MHSVCLKFAGPSLRCNQQFLPSLENCQSEVKQSQAKLPQHCVFSVQQEQNFLDCFIVKASDLCCQSSGRNIYSQRRETIRHCVEFACRLRRIRLRWAFQCRRSARRQATGADSVCMTACSRTRPENRPVIVAFLNYSIAFELFDLFDILQIICRFASYWLRWNSGNLQRGEATFACSTALCWEIPSIQGFTACTVIRFSRRRFTAETDRTWP